MPPLARRNLFHDKIRLMVTLTGIIFAVVLIVVQMGLFFGFTTSTKSVLDHSKADLWITARNTPYVDVAVGFNERKFYRVLATPGVAAAQKYIVRWSQWKDQSGRTESVEVVGVDPNRLMGLPWSVVEGDASQLKQPHAVMVDEIYKDKLGVHKVGEWFEVRGYRVKVVGFTRGIRAFTTAPYVFTSFKNAQDFCIFDADQTNFVLVKAAAGVDLKQLQAELQRRLPDNDVYRTQEFAEKTSNYWMFTTGAGISVLMGAVLGLVVGLVVVTQTIYATTMDHIREFGTLKAMGAPNSYVYRVIITQAAIAAVMGYSMALVVTFFVTHGGSSAGAPIMVSWRLLVIMFFVTVGMCITAGVVSIKKVMGLDPAMVFRG
jgi:putative ABC transport system permease protein